MKLSKKTTILVNSEESNIIGHMTYAASKLWNVCNYERYHYKELGRESAPSWYSQKKDFKDSAWFKTFRLRPLRKFVRFSTSHGNHSMP